MNSMFLKRLAWIGWRFISNAVFGLDFHKARAKSAISGLQKYAEQQTERKEMLGAAIVKLETRKSNAEAKALEASDLAVRMNACLM